MNATKSAMAVWSVYRRFPPQLMGPWWWTQVKGKDGKVTELLKMYI